MAKPLEEWSIDELRMEAVRVAEELARRAAVPAPGGGKKPRVDIVRACENWVRGVAWDETFTIEMVEDELSLHERKAGQALGPLDRERLTQLWLALRSERYRDAA
jgi:hypothetical protein